MNHLGSFFPSPPGGRSHSFVEPAWPEDSGRYEPSRSGQGLFPRIPHPPRSPEDGGSFEKGRGLSRWHLLLPPPSGCRSPPYRQRCRCRKPETGLIEEASRALNLDCSKSYVVGDRGNDLEFARRIGAKGILVLTGYGKGEWEYCQDQWKVKPDWVAQDLYEAVQWILQQEKMK